jgi:signal transduction histidine kinase
MDETTLPVPVRLAARTALHERGALFVDLRTDGPGLTPAARVGIYAPLVARRSLVGVIAVESQAPDTFSPGDLQLMTGVAEQAALAIDNALWFGRLRTVGAEEERTRIARDLHDRVAQALAYLAFELDRIVDLSTRQPVRTELDNLRHDVRRVVTEVRDTLYDLRTDVSESRSLGDTMTAFLERVRLRSNLVVTFEQRAVRRLAVPLERELWRIGQEAVTNVERHARASSMTVKWLVTSSAATLEVTDDGRGFPLGTAGRMDSYGLLGMRERAGAIGATLEVDTAPGRGTSIRCRVEVS